MILAFKDMHFSYNLATKQKPLTSSGAQPEKQPLWVILAEHDFSCSAQDRIPMNSFVKFLLGAMDNPTMGFIHLPTPLAEYGLAGG